MLWDSLNFQFEVRNQSSVPEKSQIFQISQASTVSSTHFNGFWFDLEGVGCDQKWLRALINKKWTENWKKWLHFLKFQNKWKSNFLPFLGKLLIFVILRKILKKLCQNPIFHEFLKIHTVNREFCFKIFSKFFINLVS